MTPKPTDPFSTFLTPHFQYGELAHWEERRRFRHPYQLETAVILCRFFETVRARFGGRPLIITSGYRPPAVNRAIGGAADSEHLFDKPDKGACDVVMNGVPVLQLQEFIASRWPYSVGLGARKGFVHVGIRPGRPRLRWPY